MSVASLRPIIAMWALSVILFVFCGLIWWTTVRFPILGTILVSLVVFLSIIIYLHNLIVSGAIIEILKRIVLGIIITGVATLIPVIGWLIVIGWIFYNIIQSFSAIKSLCGDALISFGMYGLWVYNLVCLRMFDHDPIQSPHHSEDYVLLVLLTTAYLVLSGFFCIRVLRRSDSAREMFLVSIVSILAFPITLVIISSIVSSIRSIASIMPIHSNVRTPQIVHSHTRAHPTAGVIEVKTYTRQIVKTMTKLTMVPDKGIIGMGVTGAVAKQAQNASTLLE